MYCQDLYVEAQFPMQWYLKMGSWEVIRVRLGNEDAAFVMALVFLWEEKRHEIYLSACMFQGRPWDDITRKRALT